MKLFSALLIALTLSFPAWAQEWAIAKEKSTIGFEGTQMGASFQGRFKDFDGTITFDPAHPSAGKADIVIHINSIDANSPDRNKYAVMPDWLDTEKFPDAHFVTTSIDQGTQPNHYVAKGNLTIRGMTLPVSLPFTLSLKEGDAIMNGETSINRLDYGIGQGQWKDTDTVGSTVKITINLTAVKK